MAKSAPRKAWGQLSQAYRNRLTRAGITEHNYGTPEGAALRQRARGHGHTPEHPDRAAKNPSRYPDYVRQASDDHRQVIARKEALWGDLHSWRPRNAERNVLIGWKARSNGRLMKAKTSYMRRFLRMTADEVLSIDWSDDEWGFLFYH